MESGGLCITDEIPRNHSERQIKIGVSPIGTVLRSSIVLFHEETTLILDL